MSRTRMHADEVETDPTLGRRLLAAQFPRWADWPIRSMASYGADRDGYRLGDALAVRLPRIGWSTRPAALRAELSLRFDGASTLRFVARRARRPGAGWPGMPPARRADAWHYAHSGRSSVGRHRLRWPQHR